jgi:hypothetical protein
MDFFKEYDPYQGRVLSMEEMAVMFSFDMTRSATIK